VKIDKQLTVADEMKRDTRTMRRNDKLSTGDDTMKFWKYRHMVVLDDDSDEVVGIISHRDIFCGSRMEHRSRGGSAPEVAGHDSRRGRDECPSRLDFSGNTSGRCVPDNARKENR
jgi:CBS-domain-containing membrane protein